MKEAGFEFIIQKPDVDEDFPDDMPADHVAKFLAEKKAAFFQSKITKEIVVTADTVVILNGRILNKPDNRGHAIEMLSSLSGNTHKVMTGVCIMSKEKSLVFDNSTDVTFKTLTKEEIEFYVDNYSPYDKAGAYGAQDWIGMVAIEKIVGSYFNVMGLPIHEVHEKLTNW